MDDILLCKYFNNQASVEEIEQIEQWLKSDEAHCREFEAAHLMFTTMIMRQISETAASEERPAAPAAPARREVVRRTMRWAVRAVAVAAVVVCACISGVYFGRNAMLGEINSRMQSIEVPAGERVSVTLPDGTSVFLNGGSRMEYPPVFARDKRRVKISGEALFRVMHDESHPFVVETFASEIEVLGTTFNVFTDEEHSRFSTALAEGRVRVSLLCGDGHETMVLRPDEMALFENGHLVKRRINADDAMCWTEGYINVSNVAFDELMRRFERAFDVNILISRPTMPVIGYVSGKIRTSEGIDFALRILQRASDFKFEIDTATNTVIIK